METAASTLTVRVCARFRVVTFGSEFLVMMAMQHDTEDDYLAAFQAMDRDNDGMITIAEMNKCVATASTRFRARLLLSIIV